MIGPQLAVEGEAETPPMSVLEKGLSRPSENAGETSLFHGQYRLFESKR